MNISIANKANFVSEEMVFKSTVADSLIAFIAGDFGSGAVYVEVKVGGSFHQFADLTYLLNTATNIALPSGAVFRINFVGVNDVSFFASDYKP